MLGDIFGAIGALGRLLPGYMQGERQAIQDNWQDLQNYNQAQQDQIQNAFSEATFEPAVQMYGLSLQDAMNKSELGSMQTALQRFAFPGMAQGTINAGEIMPYLMPAQYAGMFQQAMLPLMYGNLGAAMMPGMGAYYGAQAQGAQPFYLPSSQR